MTSANGDPELIAQPRNESRWIDHFCFATAVIYLAIHYLARNGFPRSWHCYLGGVALCAIIHLGPHFVRSVCRPLASCPVPLISFVLLHVLCAVGWLCGDSPALPPVIYAVGGACVIHAAVSGYRRRTGDLLLVSLVALVFAVFTVVDAWGGSNKVSGHPLFDEELASGQGDNDLLFHASIASMLQVYGAPSTGLHGVPTLAYHCGGHWLIGKLCNGTGVHPLDFYVTLLVPIFYSLYLSAVLHIVLLLYSRCRAEADLAWLGSIRFWLPLLGILLLAEHTCIGQAQIEKLGMVLLQFSNQSYIVGLAYLLGATAAVLSLHFWDGLKKNVWPLTYAIVPPLLFCGGFIKITAGHLGFVAYAVILLLTGRWKGIAAVVSVAISGASILWLTHHVSGVSPIVEGISWFAFYKKFIAPESLWLHPFAQYWPLLAGFLGAFLLRKQLSEIANRTLRIALVISAALVLAAQVPCAVLQFYGAGPYYTTLSANISVIPLLLVISLWIGPSAGRRQANASQWSLAGIGLGGLALVAFAFLLWAAAEKSHAMLTRQIDIRNFYATEPNASDPASHDATGMVETYRNYVSSLMVTQVRQRPQYRMLMQLKEYGMDRASRCREECIFVPRDNQRYWRMNRLMPWANCFIGPAYARRCLIFGLPDIGETDLRSVFGFPSYTTGWNEIAEHEPTKLHEAVKSICPASVRKIRVLDQTGKLKILP